MSAVSSVVASVAAFPTAVQDIEPADIFGGFGAQALDVLPWLAAGISAAIGLYFAVLGIKKGLAWFFGIVRKA